jgi:2-keto-4-pentenoate hydratase/2-oxohepta-3-ene-1,7-dioic acid hydratase in catechol pathway
VTLRAPCTPTKIIGAGLNCRSAAEAKGKGLPAEPILFLKPPSAVIGPEAPIVYPGMVSQLGYEAELAVVMGRRCHRAGPEKALEYVLGYTLANDITAKDQLPASGPWIKGKGFDTFQPLGPTIVTDLDPASLSVEMWLNGERVQQGNTSDLIFSVPELVSYASRILTLEPGDVLLPGTPRMAGCWPWTIRSRSATRPLAGWPTRLLLREARDSISSPLSTIDRSRSSFHRLSLVRTESQRENGMK